MKLLIVNADDLGLSPGVNAGIMEAHRGGIVTSASLMANLPGAAPAVALARENPGLGIGLHLNLTAGRPLMSCPTLTGAGGRFLPISMLLVRLAVLPGARREAWAELGAQAERLCSLGVRPDHLDSHHHFHLFPPLRRLALSLAAELGLPMRLPVERLGAWDWVGDLEAGLASFVAWRLRRNSFYSRTADQTLGLRLHRSGFDGPALMRVLASVPEGVTELICHPGYVDDELLTVSSYTDGRESEVDALTHPQLREALERVGVRTGSWGDAPGGRMQKLSVPSG